MRWRGGTLKFKVLKWFLINFFRRLVLKSKNKLFFENISTDFFLEQSSALIWSIFQVLDLKKKMIPFSMIMSENSLKFNHSKSNKFWCLYLLPTKLQPAFSNNEAIKNRKNNSTALMISSTRNVLPKIAIIKNRVALSLLTP